MHTAALAALSAAPYLVFGLLASVPVAATLRALTAAHLLLVATAGVLIASISPAGMMALDALSFAASAALVRMILRPLDQNREAHTSFKADIREGLEFL